MKKVAKKYLKQNTDKIFYVLFIPAIFQMLRLPIPFVRTPRTISRAFHTKGIVPSIGNATRARGTPCLAPTDSSITPKRGYVISRTQPTAIAVSFY